MMASVGRVNCVFSKACLESFKLTCCLLSEVEKAISAAGLKEDSTHSPISIAGMSGREDGGDFDFHLRQQNVRGNKCIQKL